MGDNLRKDVPLMTIWHVINTVIVFLFTLLTAILGYMYRKMDIRMDKMEQEQKGIVVNYMDRFAEVKSEINKTELRILEAIKDLAERIDDRFVTKEFCERSHEQIINELKG